MKNMTSSQSKKEEIEQLFNFNEIKKESVKEEIKVQPEPKKEIKKPETKKVEYPNHYELTDALFWIEDILGRGLINFCLVGDIADQIRKYNDPTLLADKIEIEILRQRYTRSGRNMISSWIPQAKDDTLNEIKIDYKNVPIHIKIIDKDPGYLKNTNTVFYYITEFKVPNPYEVYQNVRNNSN